MDNPMLHTNLTSLGLFFMDVLLLLLCFTQFERLEELEKIESRWATHFQVPGLFDKIELTKTQITNVVVPRGIEECQRQESLIIGPLLSLATKEKQTKPKEGTRSRIDEHHRQGGLILEQDCDSLYVLGAYRAFPHLKW
ncbi:hypothetical protein HAX54_018691 [Datura stramonium]|uniref:Uncharacterized protein n=1 Tax=Datura stramonium TaxID=4076 RepID=A0ABS8UQ09_DATST|nr:hypothetical protein [Datura stramonium]